MRLIIVSCRFPCIAFKLLSDHWVLTLDRAPGNPLTGKEECLVNILAACYPATLPARTASYLEKAATMPSPSFSLAHILIHTGRLLSKQWIHCKTPEPVLWLSPFGNTADVKKFSFWHSPPASNNCEARPADLNAGLHGRAGLLHKHET